MLGLDRGGLRYWLYSEPTDMRKSFHTLSGLVWNRIGANPMDGDVYIFVNKRRKESYPVILQFEKWMYETVRRAAENSCIGKAIKYTLPLMPRLGRYIDDGRFCIDNNLGERHQAVGSEKDELPVLRQPRCRRARGNRILPCG